MNIVTKRIVYKKQINKVFKLKIMKRTYNIAFRAQYGDMQNAVQTII